MFVYVTTWHFRYDPINPSFYSPKSNVVLVNKRKNPFSNERTLYGGKSLRICYIYTLAFPKMYSCRTRSRYKLRPTSYTQIRIDNLWAMQSLTPGQSNLILEGCAGLSSAFYVDMFLNNSCYVTSGSRIAACQPVKQIVVFVLRLSYVSGGGKNDIKMLSNPVVKFCKLQNCHYSSVGYPPPELTFTFANQIVPYLCAMVPGKNVLSPLSMYTSLISFCCCCAFFGGGGWFFFYCVNHCITFHGVT